MSRKLSEAEVSVTSEFEIRESGGEPRVNKKKPDEADVIVGRQIQAIRMRARVSREWLGDRLGITFQQIQKYENATNRITVGRLCDIARVLDVPLMRFFEGVPSVSPSRGGFSEGEGKSWIGGETLSAEENRLLERFRDIADPNVRRMVFELADTLAASERKPRRGFRQ
ncbi:helix-turn-helix domain-containing protein [Aureimonas fodinaquatilis]|uniref:helix-turn-helix domain-containing protein n=1 Tax=Aureimonas fodinaquatilis TaxID=2565783 RepID=UPI00165D3E23|nr:helix-turn-helix transcriptional regulator [Aureimonas fodinaquatilis]